MGYFRENIQRAEGYQPGFQPRAADVVKLNTNENPYPPSPMVVAALAEITPERLRRYPDPLAEDFRRAAAELHGLAPDSIICANGGDDLLNIAFRAFCDEQHPVAYPVPTYSLYPVLANLQNCRTIEIPFDCEFNLPAKLAGAGAAMTIVCNPNAPSGSIVDAGELACLADEISGVLLVDEAYVDFAETSCIELVRNFDNVIVLRSMSKGYSLAGIRFGYGIAHPDIITGLMKIKDSYNVDAVAIAAATAALKDQQHFRQNVGRVKAERAALTEALRKLGFDVPSSNSNFVLAESRNPCAADIHNELARRNIFVRYFPYPGLDNKLRISVGTPEQNHRLLDALTEILHQ